MSDMDKDSTDGTSIKPVSSLRSHFESIGSISPSTNSTSSRASPRLHAERRQSPKEQGLHERVSLDIPRRPSPWATAKDTPGHGSQQSTKALGPPVTPRNERPRSALFHRSISARPTSPSFAPPLVTIASPKSPPRPTDLTHVFSVPHSPLPRSPAATGFGSRPAPPVPPHFVHPNSRPQIQSPALGASQEKKSPVKSPLPVRKTNAACIDTALANGPPPVNRADKPKIPLKLPDNKIKLNLEPDAAVNGQRVSPFSTPPSSDESPNKSFQMKGSDSPNRISPFNPPAVPESMRERSKALKSTISSKPKSTTNFPPIEKTVQVTVEARPGLPPRRMTEKGPQQSPNMVSKEARIASTGRIAKQTTQPVTVAPSISPRPPRAVPTPSDFLPPPKRTGTSDSLDAAKPLTKGPLLAADTMSYSSEAASSAERSLDLPRNVSNIVEYPDASQTNRRPPIIKQGIHEIDTNYDTRLFDLCGDYLCTTGYRTKAWDLSSGSAIMNLGHGEQTKVTALAFKPGATAEEEGLRLWMGTNIGDLYEVDIQAQRVVCTKPSAHSRREVVKIYRNQNSMWTLDDGGSLQVWRPDKSGLPSLQGSPTSHRVPKGHTFSLVVHRKLWLATGKDIRVFSPGSSSDTDFQLTSHPLNQQNVGEITSGAVISSQHDRVYFGHTDGKVTVYSTIDLSCLGIVNVSVYKVNALAGAGQYLWAGYNTGMIYVYDTGTQPWTTKKDWQAHSNPVANISVDRSSVWKTGSLQVASIGTDNAVRIWDGMLEDDWLENDMRDHDIEYCSFRELRALVVTWNAGAATPSNLRYEEKDSNFFRDLLGREHPPDLLVFGFQELVDLDDKKLTAKSLFKGNKKKDTDHEHMSRQYRAWRDHLVLSIEDSMPSNESYHLLHTASMVGLFSCVFVRTNVRNSISNLGAADIKRGMGGLHGNKGCLILRFNIDDSSLCLVNCHLAAGQTQTMHRNNDISAILESVIFPPERNPNSRCDSYTGGGDGSMVLDHEICILNGDLNYRIDTMGRDTVVKAVQVQNFEKLLERDQLLVSRRRNPGFRLRAFTESPITFAPTYKYDVGTDRYDTSDKHRAPAWCDRILYRGPGKVKQLDYRRHELKVSDHRPVSATFKMRIKSVAQEKRAAAWQACIVRFETAKEEMARNAKVIYLRDVLGVDLEEAKSLI